MSYQKIEIDLSAAADRRQVLNRGTPFGSVTVIKADPAAAFELAIGDGPTFPFVQGQSWERDPCAADETRGLYVTNAAQPGVVVVVWVGTGASVSQA